MPDLPLTIELPWPPTTGNMTTRTGQGRMYTQESVLAYRRAIAQLLPRSGPLGGPLRVSWLLAPPDSGKYRSRAVDFDNVSKIVADACTRGGLWADDSNKVITSGAWQWCEPYGDGAIQLTIERAGQ